MKAPNELAATALDALTEAGAHNAQCQVSLLHKHELAAEAGELNLFRTTHDVSISLVAHKGTKKGSVHLNSSAPDDIRRACGEAVAIAETGIADDANDIAEHQPTKSFTAGPKTPDESLMYERLDYFLRAVRDKYPKVVLTSTGISFTFGSHAFMNTNGVDFQSTRGLYSFGAWFSAKDAEGVSSMNGTGVDCFTLDDEFLRLGTIATHLREAEEQLHTKPFEGKCVGDIIITPDCLDDFVGMLVATLSDSQLIAGTSIMQDKLGSQIAGSLFSLHSRPTSGELASGYDWTGDGHASRDLTVVESGVLKSFLLSLYGHRKTAKALPARSGGCWVVDAGKTELNSMIGNVKRGLLVNRFSGGHPSDNGDFTGVAKNSYLIEDGELKHPVSESMVNGNLVSVLQSISAVSTERVNFGSCIYPWITIGGVTISGS